MPKIDIDRVLQMEKREEFKNNLQSAVAGEATNPDDPSMSAFSNSNEVNSFSQNLLDQKIEMNQNESKEESENLTDMFKDFKE